jgi:hypothetical protein
MEVFRVGCFRTSKAPENFKDHKKIYKILSLASDILAKAYFTILLPVTANLV